MADYRCPNCGAAVDENQKFCSQCATPLVQYEDVNNMYAQPQQQYGEEYNYDQQWTEEGAVKANKSKAPIIAAMIALVAAIVCALIFFIFANVNDSVNVKDAVTDVLNDAVEYDENDNSNNIVLEREVPDPLSLSYYDFMNANCPSEKTSAWETVESIYGYKSKYQVNEEDVLEPYVIFEVDFDGGFDKISEENFNTTIRILKDRLDILEKPYAIKYEKNIIGDYVVWVKTSTDRMGAPVFQMLSHSADGHYYEEGQLVSQSGDYSVYKVEDFEFKKRVTGEYDMFLTTAGTYMDPTLYKDYERIYNEFLEYLNAHVGENMYWVYGSIAFANIQITEKAIKHFEKTGEFAFTRLSFLNDRRPMWEESFLLKLLYVSLKGEQYPLTIDISNSHSVEFCDGVYEAGMGYHINTYVDESLRSTVGSLHPNSIVYRPAMVVVGSELYIDLMYEEAAFNDVEFLNVVKKIYETNPAISAGSYQSVYINAQTSAPDRDYLEKARQIWFYKEPKGTISMRCSYDSNATEEFNSMLESDALFKGLMNN